MMEWNLLETHNERSRHLFLIHELQIDTKDIGVCCTHRSGFHRDFQQNLSVSKTAHHTLRADERVEGSTSRTVDSEGESGSDW